MLLTFIYNHNYSIQSNKVKGSYDADAATAATTITTDNLITNVLGYKQCIVV